MNKLSIYCTSIKERIKEQHLAEKRGWCSGHYGMDENGYYAIYYKKKKKRGTKSK